MQAELFNHKPVERAPFDASVASKEFAYTLYDFDGQLTRDALCLRVELYTREILAQVGVR
jgi:hypothetical protein